MYNEELRAITVSLTDLFLDPNNPRFWTENQAAPVPVNRIIDTKVQEETERRIAAFGIDELKFNIMRNGFLPLDRIAVKQIEDLPGKYVILEGNRRLAALRSLHRDIAEQKLFEEGVSKDYLEQLKESTDQIEVLEYVGGVGEEDITWILQGIRHISGVREWEPAQRARLVVTMRGEGKSFTEIGQKFGISATAVGRLYRSFKGLEQMRGDDEYGAKVRSDYFSLFEEAYRNLTVRGWLDWNEESAEYRDKTNLQQFYSWITPDSERGGARRIHDPKHVPKLAYLLQNNRLDLLTLVDQHELSLEEAHARATAIPPPAEDPTKAIESAIKALSRLPAESLLNDPETVGAMLKELSKLVEQLLALLRRVEAQA